MGKTIWGYGLTGGNEYVIEIPRGATLLTVATRFGCPMLWAQIHAEWPKAKRLIRTHRSGDSIEHSDPYIGSYQLADGELVFHVFDGGEQS